MLNDLLHQLRAGMVLIPALLVSSFSLGVAAQTISCQKPSVYYVNGVRNDFSAAQDGSNELAAAINERFPQYGGVRVRTIHNPMNGVLGIGDFSEVAIQQDWMRIRAEYVAGILSATSTGFAHYLNYLREQLSSLDAANRRQAAIDEIKRTVLEDIRANAAPVILIAHSQGNMYVNEAVAELKTNPSTRDILGVQTIAVLGIGVADRTLFGNLPYNSELYRYITASDDLVIGSLDGVPPANFRRLGSALNDFLGHNLVAHYLAGDINGQYQGTNSTSGSARSITTQLFGELYQNASRAWPCLTLAVNPSPAIVQQTVFFSVNARDRLSGQQISGAQVSLTANEPNQSAVICSQPTDQSGIAVCNYRFLSPRVAAILIRNVPSPTLPPFESAPYYLTISDGTFDFQVTNNPNGTFSEPVPSCERITQNIGDGIIELDRCYVRKGSHIRCVGPGCVQGRLWVSVTATLLSRTSECGFPPDGYCQSVTSTQVNYGVDQGFTGVYVPGSLFHFELRDGNWQKGWPSCTPLSPLNGACEPYDLYFANFNVLRPKSDFVGFGGYIVRGTLDLTYSIFDTWTGTTYTRQNRVTVP